MSDNELNDILSELRGSDLEPSANLVRQVAEIPARHPRVVDAIFGLPWKWGWLAAAFSLTLGFGGISGWASSDGSGDDDQAVVFDAADREATTEEEKWEELSALAMADAWEGEWP